MGPGLNRGGALLLCLLCLDFEGAAAVSVVPSRVILIRHARACVRTDYLGEGAVNNRRFRLPAAIAGSIGIALAPALAEAATASSQVTATQAAGASQQAGQAQFTSPVSRSVFHRTAAGESGETTPDPNLAVGLSGYDSSSHAVAFSVSLTGLNAGTVSVTITWGDGTTSTQSLISTGPSVAGLDFTHTYSALGTYVVGVSATDGEGDSAANSTAVVTGSEFVPYGPTRILDTVDKTGVTTGAVKPGQTAQLKVVGAGTAGDTIPAGITAVVLNVTVTEATANGYLTVYGDDDVNRTAVSRPDTSNLNFQANQNVANLVVVPVGADGTVDFYNGSPNGSTQVIADVAGYYTASAQSAFVAVNPIRILNTSTGVGVAKAPIQSDTSIDVTVAGADGIPDDATAVALNLTAVDPPRNGLITAYPAGESLPTVSNLNYTAGSTRANMAIVPIGTNGQIAFENNSEGSVDLIADATGYYTKSAVTGASAYVPLRTPIRYIDTRPGSHDGYPSRITGPLNALTPYWFPVGVPMSAISPGGVVSAGSEPIPTSVVVNATVVSPTGNGYLSLYPYDPASPTTPTTSNLNYLTDQTIPNLAVVTPSTAKDGPEAAIYLGGRGTAEVILDESGYFAR